LDKLDGLLSRSSDDGRVEGAANYRHREMALSVTEQTTVRNAAHAMGVDLTVQPTGETAQMLLLRLHGIVLNNIAYAGQQMQAAMLAGREQAALKWQTWREPWYLEKVRIELALKGNLSGTIGRN